MIAPKNNKAIYTRNTQLPMSISDFLNRFLAKSPKPAAERNSAIVQTLYQ